MTSQMPPGSQIAFTRSWLERQGIEAQTIDVEGQIDPSLSYEENIKLLKRQFKLGGGRSRQPAARGLSAAECDVAIGNYEAGYNGEVMRDACACGHPDACVDLERKGREAKKAKLTGTEVAWRAAQAQQRAAAAKPRAKKASSKSNIEKVLGKLRTLDAKERELKLEERSLRRSQPVGQESPAYSRLLDKIIEIQAKKAKIWNTELRSMVIPETGKTMWQMAIASEKLPVNLHGQEHLLHFNVPDLLTAVKKHKRKPDPIPIEKESGYTQYMPGVVSQGAKVPKTRAELSKVLYGTRVEMFRDSNKYDVNRRVTVYTGKAFGHVMGNGYNMESAIRSFCLRNQIKDETGRVIVKMRPDAHEPAKPAPAPTPLAVPMGLGGGGIPPIPGVEPTAAPKPVKRRQPAAKPAKAPKPKKKAAKPAKAKNGKKPAPKLTAKQRKHLNETGSVMVRRGGKFIQITR